MVIEDYVGSLDPSKGTQKKHPTKRDHSTCTDSHCTNQDSDCVIELQDLEELEWVQAGTDCEHWGQHIVPVGQHLKIDHLLLVWGWSRQRGHDLLSLPNAIQPDGEGSEGEGNQSQVKVGPHLLEILGMLNYLFWQKLFVKIGKKRTIKALIVESFGFFQ